MVSDMTYIHFNPELRAVEPCDAPTPEDCPLGLWTVHGSDESAVREAYRAWLIEGEDIIVRYYAETELYEENDND